MLRIIPLLILTLTLLTACESKEKPVVQATQDAPSIVVVDTARIFRESEPGKAGVEFLKKMQGEMQEKLGELQAQIQADPENMELQQSAQAIFAQLQQRMSAEEQNVVNMLNDLVQRTLDDYRTHKKVLLIVGTESALSYDKSIEVTTDIITAINKNKIVYKSVMPEAPQVEAPQTEAPKTEEPKAEEAKQEEAAPAADAPKQEAAPAEENKQ